MPNLACRLLLWVILCLLLATRVHAEPQRFTGIWCQTREQVERVVVLGSQLGGAQEGIIAVNKEAEGSCFFGQIVGVRQTIVGSIESPDGLLDVTTWNITVVEAVADFESNRIVRGPLPILDEMVRFTLEGSKKIGA